MTALESRNFWPLSSQVISGWSGRSSTVAAAAFSGSGQLKAASFVSHSVPGFCAQATGSSIDAPWGVAWGLALGTTGLGDGCDLFGVAFGEGEGDVTNGAGRGFGDADFVPALGVAEGLALPLGLADGETLGDGVCVCGVPGCGAPA